ncbi:MAG: triose-phosphate isomerase [Candidatus Muiribacteriota bacterium]
MRKKFIAGNWKMNNNLKETVDFITKFTQKDLTVNVDIGIAPSFVNLTIARELLKNTDVKVIAQNVFYEDNGAFTGEISADMLKAAGIDNVIIGHSERRQYFGETEETVNKRIKKALENDMKVIVCVGEKLQEREQNITNIVLEKQLNGALKNITKEQMKNITIAYEPVWAIGTGKSAKKEDAEEACKFIRNQVKEKYNPETAENLIIQYGGSVKPENAKEYMSSENIDGALVGGASLKAEKFYEIIKISAES